MSSYAPESTRRARFATLPEWLRYLERLNVREINLGLDRMQEVTAAMGLEQPRFPTFSVAGTNGKGSSVALLETIYRHAGYRVGSYTSPHLVRYTERIRIDGREVEEHALCEAFAAIDEARGDVPLTYFEFGTLAAFMLFADADLDLAVLEVGLGGRLDAVNWVDADIAIVTSIGLDHTEWLGDTREAIGREKAGIFRPDCWAVSSDPDTPDSVFAVARERGTDLAVLGVDYGFESTKDGWCWWSRISDAELEGLPLPRLPGRFQYRNAAGVVQAAFLLRERLPISDEDIAAGIAEVDLAGRFQQFESSGLHYVFDVAHNPQAATALAENLKALPDARRCHVVVGMLNDKDHRGVVGIVAPFATDWYFVSLPSARATAAETLMTECRDLIPDEPAQTLETVADALARIHAAAAPGDRVVICGSFVTVGEALRELQDVWQTAVP